MTDEEKTYSQMRKEFYEKYRNNVLPIIKKLEISRKNKLRTVIVVATIPFSISFLLALFYLLTGSIKDNFPGIIIIFVFLSGIVYATCFAIKKSFESSIKKKIMPVICSCFGNITWSQHNYSDSKIFVSSGVIPEYKDEYYDDIFVGSYKDVNIEIVEPRYLNGPKKREIVTVFDGVIIKLDMNKPFNGHTVIKSKELIHTSPSKELHHTELEDVEFNKKFDVFTNDEVEARYLITPSFMERLKNMKTAFFASSVSCAFYGNFLIIALPTNKDLFSIGALDKPIEDSKQYFQMYEEIVSIIKLIDHFKLSQKIGL